MKHLLILALLVISLWGLTFVVALAQDFPPPIGFVSDYAGVLSDEVRFELDSRLSQLEKDTTAELAVVTITSLDGTPIQDYAVDLFNTWKIGKQDQDNGVLLIMSLEDHDVWIEVGYGLESVITDGRAGRILDTQVIPSFKTGDYEQGITDGVIALEGLIRDGTPPSAIEENPIQNFFSNFHLPLWLLITLGIITIYILGFMARTKSIWLGGIWGFILGLLFGFGFGKLLLIILLPIGGGILGTLLDIVISANYTGRASSGMPTGWFSSAGGFSGSGGGNRFGGFGGGSSGGGGAGRKW